MDKVKLTNPQRATLEDIVEKGSTYYFETYPPAVKLISLGFARFRKCGLSDYLEATTKGREYYAEHMKGTN